MLFHFLKLFTLAFASWSFGTDLIYLGLEKKHFIFERRFSPFQDFWKLRMISSNF